MSEIITIYLDKKIVEMLDRIAEKDFRSRSNLIETILRDYLKDILKK